MEADGEQDPTLAFQLIMLALVDIATNLGDGVEQILGDVSDGISPAEAQALADPLVVGIITSFVARVDIDIEDINTHRQTAGLGTGPVALALISIVNEIDANGDNNVTEAEIQAYLLNVLGT